MSLLSEYLMQILGGLLIGLAAGGMLLSNGKVLGISGILSGIFVKLEKFEDWRWIFLLGLFSGSVFYHFKINALTSSLENTPIWLMAIAGVLVGFGAGLGNGCTSGHGVCGISRLSIRSLLATITFVLTGILAVAVFGR
ncbi:YeeE/YedE family protein [Dolichospermum sp. ST_sed1]|nr:YeeE/YedE family protein [Dolichospermum sp. ST_sed1]